MVTGDWLIKSCLVNSQMLHTHRIPDTDVGDDGELKQDSMCIDTLGHQAGGTMGMYKCHGEGGNQVNIFMYGNIHFH